MKALAAEMGYLEPAAAFIYLTHLRQSITGMGVTMTAGRIGPFGIAAFELDHEMHHDVAPKIAEVMTGTSTKRASSGGRFKTILLLGATGTIGRAAVRSLVGRGYEVVCFARQSPAAEFMFSTDGALQGASLRTGDVTDDLSIMRDAFRGESFDAILSCMASRTGAPEDAWAIDFDAHMKVLAAARHKGVRHMILLSAICVQKPLLAFQQAKLAFERELVKSGLTYSIVRPTAFFKSLSGQVDRVKRGKPFLVFGDGTITSCKPISDHDLAEYLADCLEDERLQDRVLPIGGPGDAITPRRQGEYLFDLLGQKPRFRHVPVQMLDAIVATLSTAGRISSAMARKAELARIGRYYATESMLVMDQETGRYDAAATPSYGSETLFDYYKQLVASGAAVDRGDHTVFR